MGLLPISMICFCTNDGESFYRLRMFNHKGLIKPRITENKNVDLYGNFRKPLPGMLNFAKNYYGVPDQILMVGDRPEDEQAAIAANVPFMWADTWRKNDPSN